MFLLSIALNIISSRITGLTGTLRNYDILVSRIIRCRTTRNHSESFFKKQTTTSPSKNNSKKELLKFY